MIEVENLSKQYGKFQAVEDLSFSIPKGQVVGFLGPNGAGKTTTMRMLTTFIPPSGGSAQVAGYDIYKQGDQVRSSIGYLPEAPSMYPELSVRENIDFFASIRGLSSKPRKKAVDQVIERCLLGDVRSKLASHISRGYRQRVGLACALVHEPEVVILDEPTSGLDPQQIIEIRKLIRELGETQTVILSTHVLPEVTEVCSHVIIIAGGKLVEKGSVAELTAEESLEKRFLQAVAGVQRSLPEAESVSDSGQE
ncbi:UNVERIFIED_CONTAM: hypothetical protein GTU68_051873 [Idotea baltica]|nr:hypothetical protein [Idotea baltica]